MFAWDAYYDDPKLLENTGEKSSRRENLPGSVLKSCGESQPLEYHKFGTQVVTNYADLLDRERHVVRVHSTALTGGCV